MGSCHEELLVGSAGGGIDCLIGHYLEVRLRATSTAFLAELWADSITFWLALTAPLKAATAVSVPCRSILRKVFNHVGKCHFYFGQLDLEGFAEFGTGFSRNGVNMSAIGSRPLSRRLDKSNLQRQQLLWIFSVQKGLDMTERLSKN